MGEFAIHATIQPANLDSHTGKDLGGDLLHLLQGRQADTSVVVDRDGDGRFGVDGLLSLNWRDPHRQEQS